MIIAGTGHRPNKLGGYDNNARETLTLIALEWLREHKPDKVISGMALGWDQALATAAILRDIPFIAAVPFKGQEEAWPASSRSRYHAILAYADEVVIVSEGGYSAKKMQIRNEWMVNKADRILAMWDGTPGGTGNCIRYARNIGKPIDNLYEIYKKVGTI